MKQLVTTLYLAASVSLMAQNPMLVLKEGDFSKDAPEIKELAAALGAPIIVEAKANPVCCVWVTKLTTPTTDGKPGYIMLKADSVEVFLTDLKAASSLATRLQQLKGAVPKGITTNYVVNDDATNKAVTKPTPAKP